MNDFAAIGGHSWKIITGERSASESTFINIRDKTFNWFQKYTDKIVCNSKNAYNMWAKHYPHFKDKLTVIYNCVQLGDIHSKYEPKRDGKLHLIVAATYQFLKNPLGLIEALKLMTDEEKELFVVDWFGRKEISRGDTQAYDDTVKAIKENRLEDIIILHSDTKDIADQMYQADAVMLLSRFEGLPNVICEGMMIGKPIIMSRVSDFNVLVNSENGFLCDWDNPHTIKDSILLMSRLQTDRLLMMGNASLKKAQCLFSQSTILEQWMKIIS